MEKTKKYKIIDVHTHIFPDKIAQKAVEAIGSYYGVKMARQGTVDDLLKNGQRIGVDYYIVHSSATQLEQVRPINDYISSVQSSDSRFIGFGSLHRSLPDINAEVESMIAAGLNGVKLHPEFQGFNIDDEEMLPVYRAIEGKLPVMIHMGDENSTASSPLRLSKIIDLFPRLVVIAAHFGGYRMWDEACEYLIGRNIYMDTSSSLYFLSPERAEEMIRKHGVEKMLFGSDYPMWDHEEELERFLRLNLSEKERKMILFENACKLLKKPAGG